MRTFVAAAAFLASCEAFSMPSIAAPNVAARPAVSSNLASSRLRMAATLPAELDRVSQDLSSALPDCPETIWNSDGIDLAAAQAEYKKDGALKDAVAQWVADETTKSAGLDYFIENKEKIKEMLTEHGSIWFRGFDLMKETDGFRKMWAALDLEPCLDPIHSSGLRAFLSESDAIYEEVNKESLCQHYIGLHNESTDKKTSTYGAFVCFQEATEGGGQFLIADGAAIVRDMDPAVLERMYSKKVRISVSNLDLGFLKAFGQFEDKAKEDVKELVDKLVAPKFDMDLNMIYGADGKPNRLQAVERAMSPVNRHPVTGKPVWFCNVHNHARYLRDNRPCTVPEVGMTNVYYGDLSPIPTADLDHIDDVSRKNIKEIAMKPGDVLLVDNYRVLHGRDTFEGDRLHAVTWFKEKGVGESGAVEKPGNMMSNLINSVFIKKSF